MTDKTGKIIAAGSVAIIAIVTAYVLAGHDAPTSAAADSALLGFLVLAVCLALYLLPTIIAACRDHHQIPAIAVINIFLGWTFLGWVVALAWAMSRVEQPAGA